MVQWTDKEISVEGSIEREFTVDRAGSVIPGVFWRPKTTDNPAPLVLLGHGGSGHKRNQRMPTLGRLFSGTYG